MFQRNLIQGLLFLLSQRARGLGHGPAERADGAPFGEIHGSGILAPRQQHGSLAHEELRGRLRRRGTTGTARLHAFGKGFGGTI